jgi:glycosyltransferase involved in cell wall biosynthesis
MLTIYGPIEDLKYWEQCEVQIADLPTNVQVNYVGELAHQEVAHALSQHGLFFLPTRGENYGHVIQEALTAGLPVLISDQTPWRDLEQHCVGWALPLGDPSAFAKIIDTVASWSAEMTEAARARAKAYAQNKASDMDVVHANLELFRLVQAKR